MRAVGLSYGRLLRVPYMFAIALALLNFGIVGFVQPLSRHAYEALRFELRSGALGASIKVGEFTNLGKRMTLRIERSLDEGRNLQGIFVRAVGKDGQRSEEHTSELQSLMRISYAVFCLKKKKNTEYTRQNNVNTNK